MDRFQLKTTGIVLKSNTAGLPTILSSSRANSFDFELIRFSSKFHLCRLALIAFVWKLHRFEENLTLFDPAITLFVVGVALFVVGRSIGGLGVVGCGGGGVIIVFLGMIRTLRVKIIGAGGVICGLAAGSLLLVTLLVALSRSPLLWEPQHAGLGC